MQRQLLEGRADIILAVWGTLENRDQEARCGVQAIANRPYVTANGHEGCSSGRQTYT
jgi:hypothetical protein